jgi:hypothetical protein
MWDVGCGMWNVGCGLVPGDKNTGFDPVPGDEKIYIGSQIINLAAYLGKRDKFLVAPSLGGALGNFHQANKFFIVHKDFAGFKKVFGNVFCNEIDFGDQTFKVIFGDKNYFHNHFVF